MCCNRVFAASGNVSIPPGGNAPLGGIGMRKSPARTRGFFRALAVLTHQRRYGGTFWEDAMSSKKLDAAIDALVDALGPSTSLNSGSVATRSASALPIPALSCPGAGDRPGSA